MLPSNDEITSVNSQTLQLVRSSRISERQIAQEDNEEIEYSNKSSDDGNIDNSSSRMIMFDLPPSLGREKPLILKTDSPAETERDRRRPVAYTSISQNSSSSSSNNFDSLLISVGSKRLKGCVYYT